MPLFDRVSSVTVGKTGNETGVSVSDLRVVFTIKKTANPENNNAEIQIYNLSETSRELFSDLENKVTLKAGYAQEDGEKIITVGKILDYSTTRQGGDVITKIVLGDGAKELNETTFSKSYKAGTSAWEVLSDIIEKIGLPKNVTTKIKGLLGSKGDQFANALSMTGMAKDQMDKIVKKLNLEWSVQNEVLKLMEQGKSDDDEIILLDPESGLVGYPIKKTKEENNKKLIGYDVKSLLLPELEPGSKLAINSEEISNGLFRVDAIEHRGDNYGQEWNSFMFVVELA